MASQGRAPRLLDLTNLLNSGLQRSVGNLPTPEEANRMDGGNGAHASNTSTASLSPLLLRHSMLMEPAPFTGISPKLEVTEVSQSYSAGGGGVSDTNISLSLEGGGQSFTFAEDDEGTRIKAEVKKEANYEEEREELKEMKTKNHIFSALLSSIQADTDCTSKSKGCHEACKEKKVSADLSLTHSSSNNATEPGAACRRSASPLPPTGQHATTHRMGSTTLLSIEERSDSSRSSYFDRSTLSSASVQPRLPVYLPAPTTPRHGNTAAVDRRFIGGRHLTSANSRAPRGSLNRPPHPLHSIVRPIFYTAEPAEPFPGEHLVAPPSALTSGCGIKVVVDRNKERAVDPKTGRLEHAGYFYMYKGERHEGNLSLAYVPVPNPRLEATPISSRTNRGERAFAKSPECGPLSITSPLSHSPTAASPNERYSRAACRECPNGEGLTGKESHLDFRSSRVVSSDEIDAQCRGLIFSPLSPLSGFVDPDAVTNSPRGAPLGNSNSNTRAYFSISGEHNQNMWP